MAHEFLKFTCTNLQYQWIVLKSVMLCCDVLQEKLRIIKYNKAKKSCVKMAQKMQKL